MKSKIFFDSTINVTLIGAGGNGSELFESLIKINHGLKALGHEVLNVTVLDDDKVEEHNILRQRFYFHEVGEYKSLTLVHRANMLHGTNWEAMPRRFTENDTGIIGTSDLVITAVDTVSARIAVHKAKLKLRPCKNKYWLDLGVDRTQGQIIFGGMWDDCGSDNLPNLIAYHPELLSMKENSDIPSCSAAESISRQDLFVNSMAAQIACNMLWRAVRMGMIENNYAFFDLVSGAQTQFRCQ